MLTDHFINKRGLFRSRFGLLFEKIMGALGNKRSNEERQGGENNNHDRYAYVDIKHYCKRAEYG